MVTRKGTSSHSPPGNENVMEIDLGKIYSCEGLDIVPDITVSRYSNIAYIVCSQRDVHIDFLEMPGVKKEGGMVVNGTRIYMGHAAAQRLADALTNVLEKVYHEKGMDMYTPAPLNTPSEQVPQAPGKRKKSVSGRK